MPLELRPVNPSDALSWTRIRALAYYGPTHHVLHKGPVTEASIRGVAENHKRDLDKPNTWHWKIVDTDLPPSADDPPDNGGRTITISVWSMHNVKEEGSNEPTMNPTITEDEKPSFVPPELRLDALSSLMDPLQAAQKDIMGASSPYFMLNSLITHPEQQGRGAARMMLDWGLREADKRELPTYLVATSLAKPIYEKRGFVLRKSAEWDRERWGGVGREVHWFMVRDVGRGVA